MKSILQYLIPEKLKDNLIAYRKGIIISYTHLLLFALAFLSFLGTQVLDLQNNIPYLPIFLAIFVLIFIFKKWGSIIISGNLILLLLYLVMIPLPFSTGGLYSSDLVFLITLPIFAFAIVNRVSGLFWALLSGALVVYFYFLENQAAVSFREQTLHFDSSYYLIFLLMMLFVITSINLINEKQKNDLIQELEKQKQALHTAQEQMETQNILLEEQVSNRTASLLRSNEELLQTNKDLEQFAYAASHDLQEPLRMVGNFVELLQEEYSDKIDEEGNSYITFAVDGVKRMSSLIEQLLIYSRVGRKDSTKKLIAAQKLVEDGLQQNEHLIQSLQAEIVVSPMPEIYCESKQIKTVFYHLINNGLKFNKSKKPVINIQYQSLDTKHLFIIEDNGMGIEKKNEDKVFEIFKRLHRKEEYAGTGVGLAISRKIIHHHNGKIWFESELGKGSRFYFTLAKPVEKK